jgi:RecA-family ATPase
MFRCIAAIANEGGKCIEHFYADTPEGHQSAEAFAQQHNRNGWGIYDCVSLLKEQRRAKSTVLEIAGLHWDIDVRHVAESKEEIIARARQKLQEFGILSRLTDSGRGVHVYSIFREPIGASTPEADKAHELLRRMAAHLGADMAPTHFAALMRRPGTINSKEGGGPCQIILNAETRCELSDIETYLDLVEDTGPLFTATSASSGNGQGNGPVDIESELTALASATTIPNINDVQVRIITSMIWRAEHPMDISKRVVDATMQMADRLKLNWNRAIEEKAVNTRVGSQYHSLFEAEYDVASGVPVWLPMEFHEAWSTALADGRRPSVSRNGAGWHIRSWSYNDKTNGSSATENSNEHSESPAGAERQSADETPKQDNSPKAPFILRPFRAVDPLKIPPREFLYGRHYQRRVVSCTAAPGGTGKSSLVLVESIAMATARDLLEEGCAPQARQRVWYHNGEDNMAELERRVVAICQNYNIPQEALEGFFFMTSGNEVPLRVAESWNQARLNINHRLVKCVTEQIGDNKIDVVGLDPLVTLHGVKESDPGQMDGVLRIFGGIADTQNCALDLSHHTRKLAPGGAEEITIDDVRGAKAISDAARTVRLLNYMSPKDAADVGLMEIERTGYFRIDRGKGNYTAPSKAAIWRRFQNVDLPNGDAVGVVVPWLFPGQDGRTSPEKLEAERKAEYVFLEILRRLTLAGRFVGERGSHNAPHVFAKERESKVAKVGKAAFDAAMRRLFDKGKIRIEEYMKADRHPGTRIVET